MAKLFDSAGEEIELEASGGGEVPRASIAAFRRIGVVGDSFASGTVNVNGGQPSYTALSWPQVMGRLVGAEVVNYTKAGLSTRTWLTDSNGLTKLLADDPQGLYILALGINDDNLGSSYIGTAADVDTGADTFYGNYGKIIKEIMAHAPGSKQILTTLARQEPLKAQLDTAIKALAARFGIPCIVLEEDEFFTTGTFPMSSGHPSVVAYSGMAEAMARLVGECMAADAAYFADYADGEDSGAAPPADLAAGLIQGAVGCIAFGTGGAQATSAPYYAKKPGYIGLGDSFARGWSATPTNNSVSGQPVVQTSTGTISGICMVKDTLLVAVSGPDDRSGYGLIYRIRYDPRTNTLYSIDHIWHPWGHLNAWNWVEATDTIWTANGSADYTLENKIYLIPHASALLDLPKGSVVDFDEWTVEIDADPILVPGDTREGSGGGITGAKLNVIGTPLSVPTWNYSLKAESLPNVGVAVTDDGNKTYYIALGYDTTLPKLWDGTYTVLAAYTTGDPNETVGNPGSYTHCIQDMDWFAGVLYAGHGHDAAWWSETYLGRDGKYHRLEHWVPAATAAGALSKRKHNGIAVTKDWLILAYGEAIHWLPR